MCRVGGQCHFCWIQGQGLHTWATWAWHGLGLYRAAGARPLLLDPVSTTCCGWASWASLQGTGFTEQQEFDETYGLAVVRVPPHRPSVRRDKGMQLFLFEEVRHGVGLD